MAKRASLTYGDPIPKSLGRVVDEFKEVNALRLAMEKEVKEVQKRENELKDHLIDNLSASDTTGVAGLRYRAQVTTDDQPTVEDWDAVHDYVWDNDRFDLLGKSIAKAAVKEMMDAGQKIPGIGKITIKKLSVKKL